MKSFVLVLALFSIVGMSFISTIKSQEQLTCNVGKGSNVTSVQCPGGQCLVKISKHFDIEYPQMYRTFFYFISRHTFRLRQRTNKIESLVPMPQTS